MTFEWAIIISVFIACLCLTLCFGMWIDYKSTSQIRSTEQKVGEVEAERD